MPCLWNVNGKESLHFCPSSRNQAPQRGYVGQSYFFILRSSCQFWIKPSIISSDAHSNDVPEHFLNGNLGYYHTRSYLSWQDLIEIHNVLVRRVLPNLQTQKLRYRIGGCRTTEMRICHSPECWYFLSDGKERQANICLAVRFQRTLGGARDRYRGWVIRFWYHEALTGF